MGSQVEKVLKVDMKTLKRKKGIGGLLDFLEIDLTSPLCSLMIALSELITRESICFSCGKYRHEALSCKKGGEVNSDCRQEELRACGIGNVEREGPWMMVKEGRREGRERGWGRGK